jgi:hypothetical protein
MSKCGLVTDEQKNSYVEIWKYLSGNGKLFIPIENTVGSSAVYMEDYPEENRKVVRSFMDAKAMELYISLVEKDSLEFPPGSLKVGLAPVKLIQEQLYQVYGKESKDGLTVECVLSSFDVGGNMKDIDTIWSQINN